MTGSPDRQRLYEDIVHRMGAALRAARMYASTHPNVAEHIKALHESLVRLHRAEAEVLIGFVGGEVIGDDTPLLRTSVVRAEITREMQALGINRIQFERGVTVDDVAALVRAIVQKSQALRAAEPAAEPVESDADFLVLPHLRAGRIPVDSSRGTWGSGAVPLQRVYSSSVDSARMLWESAQADGQPDLPTARETVENLAEAVGASHGMMIGLTGMKAHDDYTFTHMVNVSILTMAQARSLGVEGDQLRSVGLAGLLHDIGKVRTPLEILTKSSALTPHEFDVMKRHPVDGAAILRGTREMPPMAGIVAFEHHLRADGAGYPIGLSRPTLNLATVLCGIADVYDAMRSKRSYQEAFPTDRILEVMRRNDGRQFDQNLVRRFISLMGVFPPATIVRLSTGEVAVVVENDGPMPDRPTVQIVIDSAGARLAEPQTRRLWAEAEAEDPESGTAIVAALDPASYPIDPIGILAPAS
ncbi:MAG: HD-GYP domain-containing protein [Acidobacteria bacterium]|nr:HD-GYP domain-containing protein [Acidobacteriota bacterium]